VVHHLKYNATQTPDPQAQPSVFSHLASSHSPGA